VGGHSSGGAMPYWISLQTKLRQFRCFIVTLRSEFSIIFLGNGEPVKPEKEEQEVPSFFPFLAWIIHESRRLQMRGVKG